MTSTQVTLDETINKAKNRKKELKKNRTRFPQLERLEINLMITELNEEILTLERIRGNQIAAQVIVEHPDEDSMVAFKTNLQALHQVIQLEQTFDQVLSTAHAILEALNEINNAGERT